jgi:hypothetical protein
VNGDRPNETVSKGTEEEKEEEEKEGGNMLKD